MSDDTTLEPGSCSEKKRCSDCRQCQMCGETRCRICRKSAHKLSASGLGWAFTHGEYLEWKKKNRKHPDKNIHFPDQTILGS